MLVQDTRNSSQPKHARQSNYCFEWSIHGQAPKKLDPEANFLNFGQFEATARLLLWKTKKKICEKQNQITLTKLQTGYHMNKTRRIRQKCVKYCPGESIIRVNI